MGYEASKEILMSIVVLVLFIMFIVYTTKTIFRVLAWILKKFWSLLTGKESKKDLTKSDDWLTRAQARQEIRFKNSAPPQYNRSQTATKKSKAKGRKKQDRTWYPSGWVFNEETQLWEPPDYLSKESKEKWEWDEEKRIWIDKEKDRKYHLYEEASKVMMSFGDICIYKKDWKNLSTYSHKKRPDQNTVYLGDFL